MPMRHVFHRGVIAAVILIGAPVGLRADTADVVAVEAAQESDGTWRFSVTVTHPDEGEKSWRRISRW